MFSGSQCCLRSKVNTGFLAGYSSLNQPLLFLYPPWFATNLRHTFTDHRSHETVGSTNLAFRYSVSNSRKRAQFDIVASSEPQDAPEQSPKNSSEACESASRSTQLKSDNAVEETLQAILDKRQVSQGHMIQEGPRDGLFRRVCLQGAGSTSTADGQEKRKRKQRSIYQDSSRWERALNMLAESVPQQKKSSGEEIWLSRETLIMMSGTSGANSWVHHTRGGCEVEVTDAESSTGTMRQVFLNGSDRAVALTKEYFLSLEKGRTEQKPIQHESGPLVEAKTRGDDDKPIPICDTHPTIRNVFIKGQRQPRHEFWGRVDSLPEPIEWSVRTFLSHIEDSTTKRAPRLVRRELYGLQDDRHNVVVADTLCRLFTDTETARFASTVALNRAFAFLCKHSELFHQTTLLYEQARHLRLTLQNQTYGYLLRAMLLQDEMTIFRQIWNDMRSEGHMPNSQVWLTLLESAPSLRQKRITADWMRRKELLRCASVKGQVAAEIIKAQLKSVEKGTVQADQLITSIDCRFGIDWISQSSVRLILQACVDNKAWDLAIHVLKEALKRQVRFDSAAISDILLVMQHRGSLRDSLNLLRSHFVKTTGRDDQNLIPIIFMTAWRHRFYNVCRVLWRYATTLGVVTYKMQNVVRASLVQNHVISISGMTKQGPTIAAQEWRRRSGKVIVGTDLDIRGFKQLFSLIASPSDCTSANPMVWLAQYTADGEPRDQQLSLAYVMLYRDLAAWKHFAPPSSERVFELLSNAYAMDVRWKSQGIGLDRGGKSTQWMIENAIDVPLVRREISFQAVPAPSR